MEFYNFYFNNTWVATVTTVSMLKGGDQKIWKMYRHYLRTTPKRNLSKRKSRLYPQQLRCLIILSIYVEGWSEFQYRRDNVHSTLGLRLSEAKRKSCFSQSYFMYTKSENKRYAISPKWKFNFQRSSFLEKMHIWKWVDEIDTLAQFYQRSTYSFYAHISQKCKNLIKSSVSFYAFGIYVCKSCS